MHSSSGALLGLRRALERKKRTTPEPESIEDILRRKWRDILKDAVQDWT